MTEHDYATPSHLPNLGEDPSIAGIAEEITPDEIEEVALHDSLHSGMYDQREFRQGFEQYRKTGSTGSGLVDQEDLRTAVLRAGIDEKGDFERFLYTPVGELGEFRFFAEGDYKRVHRDRAGDVALIEANPDTYFEEDYDMLLDAVTENHNEIMNSDRLRPPSMKTPEKVEYKGKPILIYEFNQDMQRVSDLEPEERESIEDIIADAEREMKELIEKGRFQTDQPQDFRFQANERAREHINIPSDIEDLSELDQLVLSDLGEVHPPKDKSRDFAMN